MTEINDLCIKEGSFYNGSGRIISVQKGCFNSSHTIVGTPFFAIHASVCFCNESIENSAEEKGGVIEDRSYFCQRNIIPQI